MANSVVVDPKGEPADYQGPVSRYEVLASKPAPGGERFVASELFPGAEQTVAGAQSPAAAKSAADRAPTAKTKTKPEGEEGAGSRAKLYVAMGIGLGILAAGIGVFFIRPPAKADGTYDFGPLTANAYGLKAHLVTNWGDRLDYKLTVEPSDPSQQTEFNDTVYNSTRPLSIDIQLKDATGAVLCDNPVLVKFDPLKDNGATTAQEQTPNGKKVDDAAVAGEGAAKALNNARLLGQELDREHGKDIFENNVGTDGQVTSLSAQGVLPCTKKQYMHTVSWAFTSNFPVVVQAATPRVQGSGAVTDLSDLDSTANSSQDTASSAATSPPKRKIALPTSHFSVEQDDEIVGYQPSSGVVETRGGKALQMEKRDMVASALKGVDLPVRIHYRCDQFGACAVAGLVGGIQRAWLEK